MSLRQKQSSGTEVHLNLEILNTCMYTELSTSGHCIKPEVHKGLKVVLGIGQEITIGYQNTLVD